MLGESLQATPVGTTGIPGDRVHALLDLETGKIASAKDPRKWAQLLGYRSVYDGEVHRDALVICSRWHGGAATASNADAVLSAACGRQVRLSGDTTASTYDYVWRSTGSRAEEVITGSQVGTTEDGAPITHDAGGDLRAWNVPRRRPLTLITTASLRAMQRLHPEGDWSTGSSG